MSNKPNERKSSNESNPALNEPEFFNAKVYWKNVPADYVNYYTRDLDAIVSDVNQDKLVALPVEWLEAGKVYEHKDYESYISRFNDQDPELLVIRKEIDDVSMEYEWYHVWSLENYLESVSTEEFNPFIVPDEFQDRTSDDLNKFYSEINKDELIAVPVEWLEARKKIDHAGFKEYFKRYNKDENVLVISSRINAGKKEYYICTIESYRSESLVLLSDSQMNDTRAKIKELCTPFEGPWLGDLSVLNFAPIGSYGLDFYTPDDADNWYKKAQVALLRNSRGQTTKKLKVVAIDEKGEVNKIDFIEFVNKHGL